MAKFIEIEAYILVDADGNSVASDDTDHLKERYEEKVQPVADADGWRMVKVTVKVQLPEVVELRGEVAADAEPGELRVA